MRVWVALAIAFAIGLLIYALVPRKHIAAVLPSGAMDLIPGGDEIPFETPGSMEIDGTLSAPCEPTDALGMWIDNILPQWKQDEELLFFSHVPRTSGGTMSYILNATFAPYVHPASSEGRPIGRLGFFRETPLNMWSFYKTLFTHEDFSFPPLVPWPVATSLFLRDPANNRRSIYDSQGVFRRWCSGKYKNISDWIGTEDYPRQYQVEWLAGATNYWPYSKATARYVKHMVNTPEHLLQRAKENLVKTVFLGLTERHNESICMFFYSMRLHPKIEGKDWKSVHKIKSDRVSPVMLEKQKPLLGLEYELYAFAEKLFNARVEWMKRDFAVNKLKTIDFVGPDCEGVLF